MTNNKNTKQVQKLLIFSAHPDDHIPCCGTAMMLIQQGFEVTEVVFTGGENSVMLTQRTTKDAAKAVNKKKLVALRKKELSKASKLIGIHKTIQLGLPNDGITRTEQLIESLIKIVREEKPLILISENPSDYHHDHRVIGALTQEAVDRAGWGILPELGKKHKTPLCLYKTGELYENTRMDLIVDISDVIEKKLDAMKAYKTQAGDFSFQLTEAQDKYAGFFIRAKYAESFQLVKNLPIRVNDLISGLVGLNISEGKV